MGYKLHKVIVLVGMMGAGKTAVGRSLAARLEVPFLDSDVEIEAAANMSIPEIFKRDGQAFFRDREAEVIDRLLHTRVGVLSTGGGAFLQSRNRQVIADHGVAVWLKADLALLWERVRHKDTRPLLQTPDPYASLTEIFNTRVPFYEQAELTVEAAPELSIEQMTSRVMAELLQRADVLEEKS